MDILSIAVAGVAYWLSRMPPMEPLTIVWCFAAHPCDGKPYLIGLDFEA